MANTTNYNWETPDDTDLVKDGAAAIRTLGSSVDTTTKALNPSTTLGDIEYRSATANTNTRLGVGTTGQVLTVAAGVPSWATPTVGDITAVSAGTGISGGGTSGDITITNSMATAIDAKGDLIGGTGADTFSRLAVGANGTVLTADSAEATGLKWAASGGGSRSYAVFQDVKSLGTSGGTFTNGAWRTRDLQTTQINNISGASLSSNQITLPAGTYFVSGSSPAYAVYRHYTKLFNTSDSSDTLAGTIEFTSADQQIVTRSFIVGQFTIAASKTFEVQHYASTTKSSDGFGTSEGNALGTQTNVYTTIAIEKIG